MNPRLNMRFAITCFYVTLTAGCAETANEASPRTTASTSSVATETVAESASPNADAGMSWEEHIAGSSIGDIALSLPPKAIVVATVSDSRNDEPSYGHPPTIVLSVDRKLLNETMPAEIKVVWEPPPHDVDNNNVYDEPRYIEWANTPLVCPKLGERFILMLVNPRSKTDTTADFSCPSIGRHPATNDNIKAVIDALSSAEQNGG